MVPFRFRERSNFIAASNRRLKYYYYHYMRFRVPITSLHGSPIIRQRAYSLTIWSCVTISTDFR